ncbi:DUF6241 domain-containing protein [Rossellomorea sp. NPDC077527]|uniref:DUF6241 domain-containing protein n=1 Tax=Rossellomorea sp. NPDC077527 TaxID=3364510 RepID=UPI0037C60619
MKRKSIGIIVCSVLLITAIGVYIAVGNLETNPLNGGGDVSTSGVETDSTRNISQSENPFYEKVKTPLSETLIQQYIHAMSHQKIKAEEKWSFFEITDERIEFLLSQLEVNNYKHEQTYKQILTKWKQGDFSEAVSDHNAIWRIQDGNIGIATDLLSPKEEKAYIESRKKESR